MAQLHAAITPPGSRVALPPLLIVAPLATRGCEYPATRQRRRSCRRRCRRIWLFGCRRCRRWCRGQFPPARPAAPPLIAAPLAAPSKTNSSPPPLTVAPRAVPPLKTFCSPPLPTMVSIAMPPSISAVALLFSIVLIAKPNGTTVRP
jgi:hypothetical protein